MTRLLLVSLTCALLASCGVESCSKPEVAATEATGSAAAGSAGSAGSGGSAGSAGSVGTAGAARPAGEAGAPQGQQRTIVFLGDSLTAGYGLSAQEAFPARVQEKIQAAGLAGSWRVVNAGVSGDTTRGGLERLEWVFRAKPDIVFLCLGANDGLRGIDVAETERNLRGLITKSRDAGAKVLLAGMRLPSNYGPDYGRRFADLYPKLAKEYDLPLLPFLIDSVALDARYTLEDGIHPNAAGAVRVAENVWGFVRPFLAP